ncbi:O-methyltransferase family protein [Actinidia rufa]|uniref:O-methyltransferase family protein n=1 Tax=Actinidia rufa TaxID=165716 RepID=A0A7J0FP58_9ERIC|nr:O-methyltransferase family protein [Actinidia rufa]
MWDKTQSTSCQSVCLSSPRQLWQNFTAKIVDIVGVSAPIFSDLFLYNVKGLIVTLFWINGGGNLRMQGGLVILLIVPSLMSLLSGLRIIMLAVLIALSLVFQWLESAEHFTALEFTVHQEPHDAVEGRLRVSGADDSSEIVMGPSWLSATSAMPSSIAHFTTTISTNPNTYFHISTWACASSSSTCFPFHLSPMKKHKRNISPEAWGNCITTQISTFIHFHPRCGGLKIKHLAYANDLVLFSRGDPTSVSILMEKLNHFGVCSGLNINLTKSSFHSAGISDTDLDIIKGITGFSQGSFPFRYLGIPVADSKLTIAQYSPLIDRISDSISAWAGATLSYAGRTELIKSVLQGVECFWLSILPIPTGVKSKIVQLCRNFLWSGKCTVNKRPLVAWREVSLPKDEGGLGLGDSKAWNKALLTKTLWDIQAKKDTLWVQWIHQRYMKGGSFWEYMPKHEDSPLIKQVMTLRDEIIGTEASVERAIIRSNQWVPNGKFYSRFAYEFFRPRRAKITWPKFVWHSLIIPRHSFILWLGLVTRFEPMSKTGWVFPELCKCLKPRRNKRLFESKIEQPETIARRIQIQSYRILYRLFPDLVPDGM